MNYPNLHMIIDGEKVSGEGRETFNIVNPATGQTIAKLPLATVKDLDRALETAAKGFNIWKKSTPQQRANVLQVAARLIRERAEQIETTAILEQGKTRPEIHIELMVSAHLFEFYAGEVFRLYGRSLVRPEGLRSTVVKVPVGPVAAFAPWNFPLGNPARKFGAPIAAGCSVIMKPAEETPGSALAILQCLLDAGLPKEVAQVVFGIPDNVSRHLLASPIIRKVSFTGSTAVGKHLSALALEDLKTTTMELGGHAPVLVFDDISLDKVLDTVVTQKYRNAGQVCVSPTRFLIHESCFEEFSTKFAQRAKALKVGDGLEPSSQMGPLANARRLQAIDEIIQEAIDDGAELLTGGYSLEREGFFYAPTVLRNVPEKARILNEEPFGPVAIINSFKTEDDAIKEANRLPYGLAAFAWTSDAERQKRLSYAIEAGMVGINTNMIAGADSPFGGVKWSGSGSEDGPEGVEACLVTKAIHEGSIK